MTLREASFNFNSEATQKRSIGKEQLETRSKPSIQLTGEAANSSANNDEFTVGPPRRVSDVHTNIGRFSCDFLLFAIKLTVSLFDVILQTHTSCRNVQAGKFSTGETSSKARNVGNNRCGRPSKVLTTERRGFCLRGCRGLWGTKNNVMIRGCRCYHPSGKRWHSYDACHGDLNNRFDIS